MGEAPKQARKLENVSFSNPAATRSTNAPLLHLSLPAGGASKKSKNPKSEDTRMIWHSSLSLVIASNVALSTCKEMPCLSFVLGGHELQQGADDHAQGCQPLSATLILKRMRAETDTPWGSSGLSLLPATSGWSSYFAWLHQSAHKLGLLTST